MIKVNLNSTPVQPFKKRFLLIPIGILVATVIGFAGLKTFDKQSSSPSETKTTTTATVEFDKAVPPPPPPPAGAGKYRSASPPSPAMAETNQRPRVQLSVDILRERQNFKAQQQRWYAQMAFSGVMALASLYVILSKKYPDEVNKFGYSTIAFIMGFWLKGM